MNSLQNEMILASAGSGKTYRLTNRFVHLLALGVDPERIIALTFTRKAASEFLDEILKKLAQAAVEPSTAQALQEQLGLTEPFDPGRARDLLRLVLDRLHLLTLGTLDSFFHRILACFPAEFGLDSGFEVMNPHEENAARAKVFGRIFANRRLHGPFMEAFKKATYGAEEKNLERQLDDFVAQHHRTYLREPNRSRWGHHAAIWPNGSRWLRAGSAPIGASAELTRAAESLGFDKTARGMWETLIAVLASVRANEPLPDKGGIALQRVLQSYASISQGGPAGLKLGRTEYPLPPAVCRPLGDLLDHFLFCAITPHLERTQGIHQLLQTFEKDYHEQIRRSGKLGFEDIQMLLNGSLLPSSSRQQLSMDGGEGRLHVDYRLDGQFDHWLLDEFQDTSNGQWQVISNLIDEVLQDTEGRRSLFYVGDVKQAIFGWRGGDSALFNDICRHYNGLRPGSIREEHMEDSRRSGPALMTTINRVFGDFAALHSLFPEHPEFVNLWKENWAPHTTHHQQRQDYVELLTIPEDSSQEPDSDDEPRSRAITALVAELAPHQKQISCAILVRRNATAIALANAIRAHTDVPVTVDSDTLIGTDHPVASSFLSLLQFAAHPGDTLAWKHLLMTPAFASQPWQTHETLRATLGPDLLRRVHDDGFALAFEEWLRHLRLGGFVPDPFAQRRIAQLRQAAHDFDQEGNRSIADFIRYAEAASTREAPASGVVQIMTIHKSKGLGFDVVILAETASQEDSPMTGTRRPSLVTHERGAGLHREIDWILSMPRKDVCQVDPNLSAARHRCEIDRAYEELCVLYVALTRAKFATYIFCDEPKNGPKGSARDLILATLASPSGTSPTRLLGEEALPVAYTCGDPAWYSARPAPPPPAEPQSTMVTIGTRRRFPPLHRAMPSEAGEEASPKRNKSRFLFSRASRDAAQFGTKVHELFELINWLEDASPALDNVLEASPGDDPVHTAARTEVLQALSRPEILSIFHQGKFGREAVLWREKRFEMILDGAWVSGTFDRVVLTAGQAWIYDFKTNRVVTEAEIAQARDSYQAQLSVYRQALSRLTGIAPEAIATHLVFTKPGVLA